MAHLERLFHRLSRAADEVLFLQPARERLNPEVRRVIGDVGKHRHQRRPRQGLAQALAQRSIEIRNQRNHHVRPAAAPVFFQKAHLAAVKQANDAVHPRRQFGRPQRPALFQHQIVKIL